jgi:membrane protease YdiL (CAAX protease family)
MSPSVLIALEAAQFALIIGGLLLLWRLGFSAAARRTPAALPAWTVSLSDFFLLIWLVICGGLAAPFLAGRWIRHQGFDADFQLILSTAAFQLGLLAGVVVYQVTFGRRTPVAPPAPGRLNPLLAGAATFLISLPVVLVVSLLWQGLLQLCHITAPPQDAIDILRRAHSATPMLLLLLSALVIAPLSEELIFRAGIFRYVRTRLPRWAALLLPAVIFGAMHANLASFAPLVALGVVFALAYERTGRISTSMVAHALFNLSAALLALAGVNP